MEIADLASLDEVRALAGRLAALDRIDARVADGKITLYKTTTK